MIIVSLIILQKKTQSLELNLKMINAFLMKKKKTQRALNSLDQISSISQKTTKKMKRTQKKIPSWIKFTTSTNFLTLLLNLSFKEDQKNSKSKWNLYFIF
ncbi:MAG: hypothetical protein MJ252_28765 [archaeon]|nr:hypothetical protein [archaeon]